MTGASRKLITLGRAAVRRLRARHGPHHRHQARPREPNRHHRASTVDARARSRSGRFRLRRDRLPRPRRTDLRCVQVASVSVEIDCRALSGPTYGAFRSLPSPSRSTAAPSADRPTVRSGRFRLRRDRLPRPQRTDLRCVQPADAPRPAGHDDHARRGDFPGETLLESVRETEVGAPARRHGDCRLRGREQPGGEHDQHERRDMHENHRWAVPERIPEHSQPADDRNDVSRLRPDVAQLSQL
jgi:hypothetical protein